MENGVQKDTHGRTEDRTITGKALQQQAAVDVARVQSASDRTSTTRRLEQTAGGWPEGVDTRGSCGVQRRWEMEEQAW